MNIAETIVKGIIKVTQVYLLAQDYALLAKAEYDKAEEMFLKANGREETRLYMIDDEVIFEKLCKDFDADENAKKLWAEKIESDKLLKDAETALIERAVKGVMRGTKAEETIAVLKSNYTKRINYIRGCVEIYNQAKA